MEVDGSGTGPEAIPSRFHTSLDDCGYLSTKKKKIYIIMIQYEIARDACLDCPRGLEFLPFFALLSSIPSEPV